MGPGGCNEPVSPSGKWGIGSGNWGGSMWPGNAGAVKLWDSLYSVS